MPLAGILQPNRLPLALVCLLGVWLRVANLNNVAARTPDERVYTRQARVWLASGTAGMRSLVEKYERDPAERYYPLPTRAGIVQPVALVMRLTGRTDETAGAMLACAASIASLVVTAWIAMRFLPPWGALFALLFYAVSPVDLAIARRLWPDAFVEFPSIVAVWCACELAAGSRRRTWLALFAAAGAAGIAVRETFPVSYGFYLLWMLWVLVWQRRDRRDALLLAALCAAAAAASLAWLGGSAGGLADFLRIAMHGPDANAVNAYALQYASGPPWLVLEGFWIASPIAALFAAAGFYAAFAVRRETPRGRVLAGMAAATAGCLALMSAVPHYINLRYFSALFGPLYLLAGLGFWFTARWCARWLAPADRRLVATVAAAVLIGGAIGDYLRFQRFFVRDSIPDLAIRMLQDENGR